MSFYNSEGRRKEYAISFLRECGHETRLSDTGKSCKRNSYTENLAGELPTTLVGEKTAVRIREVLSGAKRLSRSVSPAQCAGAGGQGDQGASAISRRKVANERVVQGKT